MKEYLEFTEDCGLKVLVPTRQIKNISERSDGTAFIEVDTDHKRHRNIGYGTKELFEVIVMRLKA